MLASERFSSEVCDQMRGAINEAGGNEVFFACKIDDDGVVISASVASRGHSSAVPVQFELARQCDVLVHNHPSGNLSPSDADLNVASHASECAQGFYIVDNDVCSVYVVVEPVKPVVKRSLNLDVACGYLSAGGELERRSEYFEERPSQLELVKAVCNTFNSNAVGVFEAGTGVGKSYGYLVPSILWAIENKDRVVISTGTINLQQQLAEKDIPAALELIGKPLKFVLLKGRQNYVCLRRLNDQISEPDLFNDGDDELKRLAEWCKTSMTGSRSELTFVPSEYVWRGVCSESDACMGMRCSYHDQCFVMKVRKEAASAKLLVVNHHLLFADIEARLSGAGYDDTAVLPPYKRLIFDEAHGIESAATSFFSEDLTKFKVQKQLRLLYRTRKNGAVAGHLFTLVALSTGEDYSSDIIAMMETIKDILQQLDETTLALMDMQFTLRISHDTSYMFEDICRLFDKLGVAIIECTGKIRELIDTMPEDNQETQPVWEVKTVLRRLEAIAAFCKNFTVWDEHNELVFFVEKIHFAKSKANLSESEQRWFCRFVQAPLEIAPKMNAGVFEPMDSVVCTSATLRIGSKFDFWLNRTGAGYSDDGRLHVDEFPSPFPYDRNMLFAVPSDAPFSDNHDDYQSFVEYAIVQLILSAGGRTLVLFTSYESLRYACDMARLQLGSMGITVFKQGDDDRFRLLEAFRKDSQSVLFATDSFWEGVDVPGDSLSQVIIVKLPFSVPTDPIFAARSEALERRGGNAFMQLSVPDAVIKFRQGVGRLIRRSIDRGSVVVLDRRIMEKRYGRIFLDSIPECRRLYAPLQDICHSIERFLF